MIRHLALLPLLALAGCALVSPGGADLAAIGSPAPADGSGTLIAVPERPVAGARIDVVYRAPAALAAEPRLHLRARLRTPSDPEYNHGLGSRTVAVLERGRDGAFRGAFSLPEETVYAALAVEAVDSERTDTREGRFWELLVHDASGRPLFAALEQRLNDHMGRDLAEVLASAREMTRVHPDRPGAWSTLAALERIAGQGAQTDEGVERHRARLDELDRSLASATGLDADDVAGMFLYAAALRDAPLAVRWSERLLAEAPGHAIALQEVAVEIADEEGRGPAARLASLDSLWARADGASGRAIVADFALRMARETGDAGSILLWSDRHAEAEPPSRSWIVPALAEREETRREGIRRLREEIARLRGMADEERALGATRSAHRELVQQQTAALQSSLGEALIAAGEREAGIAYLERAAASGWSLPLFRSLGSAHLAGDDRESAARAFALVAADPLTPTTRADSLRTLVGADASRWEALVAEAGREMRERTLRTARADPVPPARLTGRDGSTVRLPEVAGDGPAVVVFWSRYCSVSDQAMPRIAAMAGRLADDGVRLLAVTRNAPEEAEPYLRERGLDVPVFFDTAGEAARALNSWGTPQFFVLDGSGRLRFALSSLDDVPRQVTVLRMP